MHPGHVLLFQFLFLSVQQIFVSLFSLILLDSSLGPDLTLFQVIHHFSSFLPVAHIPASCFLLSLLSSILELLELALHLYESTSESPFSNFLFFLGLFNPSEFVVSLFLIIVVDLVV